MSSFSRFREILPVISLCPCAARSVCPVKDYALHRTFYLSVDLDIACRTNPTKFIINEKYQWVMYYDSLATARYIGIGDGQW